MTARPEIVVVDPVAPDADAVARAAAVIRAGGLVAMPTETVYGLAGNALSAASIARIYAAKGRPSHNPLIAHVANAAQAQTLAAEWPEMARALAARFWPGPLTMVVRRKAVVPTELTAGLDTFGVRVPDHPVALALIRAAGVPLAAPSANRFTEVSPVTAAQVARGLGAAVDMILDAGHTRVGIESTVVDVSGGRPVLLRPGMLTQQELEAVVGPVSRHRGVAHDDAPRPAPGMVARHYAPRARVVLVRPDDLRSALDVARRTSDAATLGCLVHSMAAPAGVGFSRQLPSSPDGYASVLYDALHDADAAGCAVLIIEDVPADAAWEAIRDRLSRAAHPA